MLEFLLEVIFTAIGEAFSALAMSLLPERVGNRAKKAMTVVLAVLTLLMIGFVIFGVIFIITGGGMFVPGIIITAVGIVYFAVLAVVKVLSCLW